MFENTAIKKTFFSEECWFPWALQKGYNLFEIPRGGYLITTQTAYGYNFLVSEKNEIISDHSGNFIGKYIKEDDKYFEYAKEEVIEGNVIYIHIAHHYLHFLAETIPALQIYKHLGVFENYAPETTKILVIGCTEDKIRFKEIEYLLGIDLTKYAIAAGKKNVLYRASRVMVNSTATHIAGTILPPWTIRYLYEKFNEKYAVEKGKCLFFSRQDATYRFLMNEEEILARLKNSGLAVKVVKGSLMTMKEQIKEVNTAETLIVVAGTHGTHLMFTNKQIKNIICLGPKIRTGPATQITDTINLPTKFISAYWEEPVSIKGKALHPSANNFKINPEELLKNIV